MNPRWDGAEAPGAREFGWRGWARIIWRAPVAIFATGLCVAVFFALRVGDWVSGRRLAPWAVQVWARIMLRVLGLRLRCEGAVMRHSGALVANHASWLDIVTLHGVARVFFVSKAEVEGWPVIGPLGRAIGTQFIERRAVEAKRQTEALRARLLRGDRLCIFPEGTSSDGRRVLPFKSALFGVFFEPETRDLLWVQPVSLGYRPGPGLPADFYGWWGDMEFGGHLLSVLALSRGGEIRVVFHAPLRPTDFGDRKAMATMAGAEVSCGFHAFFASDDSV